MVGEFERNKDTIEEITATAAERIGNIAKIITDAVTGIAREIGDGVSEAIEMREAAEKAKADELGSGDEVEGEVVGDAAEAVIEAEPPGEDS